MAEFLRHALYITIVVMGAGTLTVQVFNFVDAIEHSKKERSTK